MKQELPLAGLLLAIGVLLWLSSGRPEALPVGEAVRSEDAQNQTSALNSSAETELSDAKVDPSILPAGFQQESRPQPQHSLIQERQRASEQQRDAEHAIRHIELQSPAPAAPLDQTAMGVQPAIGAFLHSTSDPRTVDLLAQVAKKTANSKPLGASLHTTAYLFDQVVHAQGRYFQAGQGTHQSRLELTFGNTPAAPTFFQMCDGRFVYRLETIGSQQKFEFVDLNRIRQKAGEQPSDFSPTGWIATGGLSSLYQHIGSAFNFGAPQSLSSAGPQHPEGGLVIRGSWNEEALRQMLIETHPQVFQRDAGASKRMLSGGNGIQWEQLPRQLPHGVEIELHPDPLTGYFPRSISFVRFQTSDAKDGQPATVPIVNIAFAAPRELPNVNEKMFVIDSTDIESVDATDGYLARIEAMEHARWARNGSSKESDPVRK